MNIIQKISTAVLIIGGLNWGLIGFFGFDLVGFAFDGITPIIARIVYALVGIAAVANLISWVLPIDEEYKYRHSLSS